MALEIGPAQAFQHMLTFWNGRGIETTVFTSPDASRVLAGRILDIGDTAAGIDLTAFDVVAMSASGYPLEADIRRRCRAAGIPVFQFIDQWYNYGFRFPASMTPRWPDRIGVIDQTSCEEAAIEGLPRDRLLAVGSPVWEEEQLLPVAPAQHIAFLGQPVVRDYGRSLGYDEWDVWAVVEQAMRQRPDLIRNILYCPHPSFSDATAERIAPATFAESTEQALRRCGTVISMFSSPMISAYLRGRRVVSVQPNLQGMDRGMLSRRGYIPHVKDVAGLIEVLATKGPAPQSLALELRNSTRRLSEAILSTPRP